MDGSNSGDIIVDMRETSPVKAGLEPVGHRENIANRMKTDLLARISATLTEEISYDSYASVDREKLAVRYIEALGIGPESKPDDYEYEFADTSDHTLLLKALTTFQAKALSALMPSPDMVVNVESDIDLSHIEDPKIRKAARKQLDQTIMRVRDFYNHYLIKAVPNYVEDFDQIINDCGLHGIGFRRILVDESYMKTPVRPIYVGLEDLILSYDATNFRGTGRVTHRYVTTTSDLLRGMISGQLIAEDVAPGMMYEVSRIKQIKDRTSGVQEPFNMAMNSHRMYDVFAYMFLAEDPHPMMMARPYVVTIHASTQKILAIKRNWEEGDPDEMPIEHFAGYVYSPGRNALMPIGLGALLTNVTMALRKAQRRGLDAAYLANHPAGFMVGGMSIRDPSTKLIPGELRTVDVGNGDIRQSILMNPFEGPDAGLISLYDRMNDAGKELGNMASIDFASMMKSGIAAGPALAAYDESTEFQTAVHRRLYRGHASELDIIHARLRQTMGGRRVMYGSGKYLEPDDLMKVVVRPAMKPGFVSRQRALIEAQAVLDLSEKNAEVINKRAAVEKFLSAMGTTDIADILLPDPEDNPPQPMDPVAEYMKLMRGEPLRAGPAQNHQAHIAAHVAQLGGLQSSSIPVQMGQAMSAALAAHIAEHQGLDMAVKVAATMGIPLEMLMEGMPPEMEAKIAPQMAAAIAAVEAERAPKDEQDPKIVVEQIRAESRAAIAEMQAEQKENDRKAKVEIARMQELAATKRNTDDNNMALVIAELKELGKQVDKLNTATPLNPNPQANVPVLNPSPPVPSLDPQP